MSLTKKIGYLPLSGESSCGTYCRNHRLIDVRNGKHLLLCGGKRHYDSVVLVLTVLILSLCAEHSDDPKGKISNAHGLTGRVTACKKIVGNGFADYADSRRSSNISFGEKLAAGDRPCSNIGEFFVCPLDPARGNPIQVSEHELSIRSNARAHGSDRRAFSLNRFGVFGSEGIV